MMQIKRFYKSFMPPFLDKKFRFLFKKIKGKGGYFLGPYSSWEATQKKAVGYDADEIIKKVRATTLRQKETGVFARDGVILEQKDYSHPLLTSLFLCCLPKKKVHVIDFGGGLGSTYYNFKNLIANSNLDIIWGIIEQSHFVDIGKTEHQSNELIFFKDLDEIQYSADLMILSSVLQYLPNSDAYIDKIIHKKCAYILMDRLVTHQDDAKNDTFMVEKVPSYIYSASYPIRIFNYSKLIQKFLKFYDIVYEFTANEGVQNLDNVDVHYRGALLKLK